MQPTADRIYGLPRVVALVIITLALTGLAYLGFAPDADPVTVPEGAQSGDLTVAPCTFEAEDGSLAADCGTLVVPENRADPASRLIALPVVRVRALTDHPAEPVFYLEGGPGITNVQFDRAGRYIRNRDLVMVGYRGVDGSVQLDCPEVDTAMARSAGLLSGTTFGRVAHAFGACADRLRHDGIDLAGYGLVDQVEDLEAARTALGYDRIDLLSESAGTRTAMIYAWRHPARIHRSVMIGVNPPGHYLWADETTDHQIARYAELCATDAACRERTGDLNATMRQVAAEMPNHWMFLPIDEGAARVFSFFGLMESTTKAGALSGGGAPFTLDAWLAAADGDPAGLWLISTIPDLMGRVPWYWGQRAAAARVDVEAAGSFFSSPHEVGSINLGSDASAYGWSGGLLAEVWPAVNDEDAYRRMRTSQVETLVVGGTLDLATPPQQATDELLPYLPNGHQVVLPGFGHTMSFYEEQPAAGTHLVNTFLDTGLVDDSLYTTQTIDFAPGTTLSDIAKRMVAVMASLALTAVVALVWMARRDARRGGFGPVASAALRSLFPIVSGLGGWFLGSLIVLATMKSVPISGAPVVLVSVSVPVGLGLSFARVNGAGSAGAVGLRSVVALTGAFIGAWIGFRSAGWPLGAVTSIIGAAAVGNLGLIAIDVRQDRRLAARPTETARPETPHPSPV